MSFLVDWSKAIDRAIQLREKGCSDNYTENVLCNYKRSYLLEILELADSIGYKKLGEAVEGVLETCINVIPTEDTKNITLKVTTIYKESGYSPDEDIKEVMIDLKRKSIEDFIRLLMKGRV